MRLLFLLLALAVAAPALAVEPSEMLADPVLEARAREISQGLRCVVCQNQTIDDSHAGIAHDMRVLLRQRLLAGDSDTQARAFIVDRYGDYVLLKPPLRPGTWLLWAAPALVFLMVGLGFARIAFRRRDTPFPPPPMAEADRVEVAALLANVEAK